MNKGDLVTIIKCNCTRDECSGMQRVYNQKTCKGIRGEVKEVREDGRLEVFFETAGFCIFPESYITPYKLLPRREREKNLWETG